MNGLARRQVPRCDHNVLAEFCHGAGMLPRVADLFQPVQDVRGKASFTIRGSIENQVAVSAIQRLKPLVHHSCHVLEMSSRVYEIRERFRLDQAIASALRSPSLSIEFLSSTLVSRAME